MPRGLLGFDPGAPPVIPTYLLYSLRPIMALVVDGAAAALLDASDWVSPFSDPSYATWIPSNSARLEHCQIAAVV